MKAKLSFCLYSIHLFWEQILRLQVFHNLGNRLLHTQLVSPEMDLWLLRCLVWSGDTGEVWNLSCACLFVQALRISLLSDLDWDIDEDLDEWNWVIATLAGICMEVPCNFSVGNVWRDERGESHGRRVSKELCDLQFSPISPLPFVQHLVSQRETNLSYPSNILISVFL
jgi:hypothetical protein